MTTDLLNSIRTGKLYKMAIIHKLSNENYIFYENNLNKLIKAHKQLLQQYHK